MLILASRNRKSKIMLKIPKENAFEEESKGSLEEGKYADIVILSENWMECTDAEILDTKVIYTIVDGKIRYQG